MLIEIHMLQNHSPANLNRDDLGAPKTCFFGGTLRSRISSQCLKRSIRLSSEFKNLKGGIRTRRLAEKMSQLMPDKALKSRAVAIMNACGISTKQDGSSDMLVFTTHAALKQIVDALADDQKDNDEVAAVFKNLISTCVHSPDMALCGRMLETGKIPNTTVEAALQVAHAISTHSAKPEIDYYVAADDLPGEDAGAGFVDEAMFTSACFYKYFSISWETLVQNLNGNDKLAAHTLGAFLRAAALTNPSGKQNSYAAHNLPDGILVEFKSSPVSYANAFVRPVGITGESDLVELSIGQFANYVQDIHEGYFTGQMQGNAFWFSPNARYPLSPQKGELAVKTCSNLDELVQVVLNRLNYAWDEVKQESVYAGS